MEFEERKEIINFLAVIEKDYAVHEWEFKGVSLWPLLKSESFFINYVKADSIATGKIALVKKKYLRIIVFIYNYILTFFRVKFDKKITVSGDKSLSIRWVLLASQATGKSRAHNLLMSEDVLAAIDSIKKLGIKVKIYKNYCEIFGNGINGFNFKKNLTIDAKNSGTLGRLILGLLIRSPIKIKLVGDKSLSERDFSRVTKPLQKFGAKFYYKKKINYLCQF